MFSICLKVIAMHFFFLSENNLQAELEANLNGIVDAANKNKMRRYAKFHTQDCVLNFQGFDPAPCKEGTCIIYTDCQSIIIQSYVCIFDI